MSWHFLASGRTSKVYRNEDLVKKVYIEKGKLEQEWSIPNKSIVKSEAERGHFTLTGDGAEYKISLKLKLDKDKNKDKKEQKK